eukprot:tig00001222_g7615.t1
MGVPEAMLTAVADAKDAGEVLEIRSEAELKDFLAALGDYEGAVVKFYKPGCPACVQMEGEYEDAAATLSGRLVFAQIDYDATGMLELLDVEVDGFPTIVFVQVGADQAYEHKGGRSADAIVSAAEDEFGLELDENYDGNGQHSAAGGAGAGAEEGEGAWGADEGYVDVGDLGLEAAACEEALAPAADEPAAFAC